MTAELGGTSDPRDLIPGSPADLRQTADSWHREAIGCQDTSLILRGVTTSGVWEGEAADAFHEQLLDQIRRWDTAGETYLAGAIALRAYADELERAQREAGRAIDLYERGERESAFADSLFQAQLQKAVADARATQTLLIEPYRTVDPGQQYRDSAQTVLDRARHDVEAAAQALTARLGREGDAFDTVIRVAGVMTTLLAAMMIEQLRNTVNDVAAVGKVLLEHPDLVLGLIGGVAGFVGGGAMMVGGGGLTLTGGGAVVGAPAIGEGLAIAGTGAVVAGAAASELGGYIASASQVEIWQATGPDRGDGRSADGRYAGGSKAWEDSKALEQEKLDELSEDLGVEIERRQVVAHVDGEPQSGRKYDGLFANGDGTYTGVEIKTGNAKYGGTQKGFDQLVSPENPATAILDGTVIKIVGVIVR
ncbi:putative T7SS-secreted protein [Agromyces larvae]|uniref:Putative T7SS secretion signal domain-containing protein n=1 Tax=Agromyces larvae TaxID=2929802 RepID=A0ABY4C4N6_9MICO|nr:hypothetical protein [Agromyces larvae]UOE44953.1 hypothetical protein MTO99_04005 [Agromyces larvae]